MTDERSRAETALTEAMDAGLITANGSWLYFGPQKLGNGSAASVAVLEADESLLEGLETAVAQTKPPETISSGDAEAAEPSVAVPVAKSAPGVKPIMLGQSLGGLNRVRPPAVVGQAPGDVDISRLGVAEHRQLVVAPRTVSDEGGRRIMEIAPQVKSQRIRQPKLTLAEAKLLGRQMWREFPREPGYFSCVVRQGADNLRFLVNRSVFDDLKALGLVRNE